MSDALLREEVTKVFQKGLDAKLIERKGPWYKFGDIALGRSEDEAIEKLMSDRDTFIGVKNRLPVVTEAVVTSPPVDDDPEPLPQPTAMPSATPPPVAAPSDVDIEGIGVIPLKREVTELHVTETADGTKMMSARTVEKIEHTAQPYVTAEEVKFLTSPAGGSVRGLSKEDFHPYRLDRTKFTAVAQSGRWKGRRFMLMPEEYSKL